MYTLNNFKVRVLSSRDNERGVNTMAKMVNQVTRALNHHKKLPKWIVIVVEEDLIKSINASWASSEAYMRMIDWVMQQQRCAISQFKKHLPLKAKKYNLPHVAWVIPTLHDMYTEASFDQRKKFIKCLRMVAKNYDDIIVLPLKQVWDRQDESLVGENNTITSAGLDLLWTAVDRSVRFADTRVIRNMFKNKCDLFHNDVNEEESITQCRRSINSSTDEEDPFQDFFRRNRQNDVRRGGPDTTNTRRQLKVLIFHMLFICFVVVIFFGETLSFMTHGRLYFVRVCNSFNFVIFSVCSLYANLYLVKILVMCHDLSFSCRCKQKITYM